MISPRTVLFLLATSACTVVAAEPVVSGKASADSPVTFSGPASAADADFAAFQAASSVKPPAPPKEMGAEKYFKWSDKSRQAAQALGLAFLAHHPSDPRRWEVVTSLINTAPLFAKGFGPDVEQKGSAAAIIDETAKAAWEARSVELKAALLASPDVPLERKEPLEWAAFATDFRATRGAVDRGEKVDWGAFRTRFDVHLAKYAKLDVVANRAADYLGALESRVPGRSLAEWKYLLNAPNAKLQEKAAERIKYYDDMAKPLEITFTAVDGRAVDLAKLRGKVVLIDFWATWCGPCIAELPNIKSVYEKYHAQGFEIIGISLDREQDKQKLIDFTAKESMPWPQHFDGKYWKNEIAVRFAINSIPAMFLVGPDGRVVTTNARGERLESEVKRLLGL